MIVSLDMFYCTTSGIQYCSNFDVVLKSEFNDASCARVSFLLVVDTSMRMFNIAKS